MTEKKKNDRTPLNCMLPAIIRYSRKKKKSRALIMRVNASKRYRRPIHS